MRDYAKVSPKFWIGATGKRLRAAGLETQVVALYLLTSPHANMLGLFYCPLAFVAHETGLGMEGASKGLAGAIEAGFCAYDEGSEVVWVYEMARFQVGERLEAKDLRCKGVQNEYDALPENPFLAAFFHRYAAAFCMARQRGESKPPAEAPSKPLRSQEQEQEQEQEQLPPDGGSGAAPSAPPPPAPRAIASPPPPPDFDGSNAEVLNGKAIVPIAATFDLPEQWGVDAEALGFKPAEVLREAEKFRQYWTAGKGQGQRRSVKGWRQTWSNWLEKASKDNRR